MGQLTNETNIPLSMAVWLAEDTYVQHPDPAAISVTGLLKSVRSIVLGKRANEGKSLADIEGDVQDKIASKLGTAIHDSITSAWLNNYKKSMQRLGYSEKTIDSVAVNPSDEFMAANPDKIAVYLENRSERRVAGHLITGEYDFVADGAIEDFKSTGTYSYTHRVNDDKYIQQMSIYRWLNPTIITRDDASIGFIFTDWSKLNAIKSTDYPQSRVMGYPLQLMSELETDAWIKAKLSAISLAMDKPEEELPLCTPDDLWQKPSTFKYFKNPAKAEEKGARSTKNFNTMVEAQARLAEDNYVGTVKEVKGKVGFCKYCPGFEKCTQKDQLIADGLLTI